jgi:hypothetical protein
MSCDICGVFDTFLVVCIRTDVLDLWKVMNCNTVSIGLKRLKFLFFVFLDLVNSSYLACFHFSLH